MGMIIGDVQMFPKIDWLSKYIPSNPNLILKLVCISRSKHRKNTKVKKITEMSSHITSLMTHDENIPNTDYIFKLN